MTSYVTPLYAAALALLFFALSVRTLRLRRELKIGIGDAGNETMLRAIRVHANFAEYVPLTLLLAALLELSGGPAVLVHAVGACLLAGRIVHAYGLCKVSENFRYRVLGMALTFTALVGGALALLALAAVTALRSA
jgi:uncharacterized membrane protein YecN with MAPEG domain